MIKRILVGCGVVGLLVLLAFILLAWESAIPEEAPPATADFSAAEVEQGRVLAGIGNCQSCHTVDPARPYAGGLAMPTPFGTLYSTNISPDPEAGIGRWSEAAFIRGMQEGVARDGSHLYPVFPYTHYSLVNDADLRALYAFIMTREPISGVSPDNELAFPFNLRMLQAGWKLLFFDDERWQPDADRSAQWNRGAYLAEGLGHCSSCHTPRNKLGAEIASQAYDGALVKNWYAPALNASNQTPVGWTQQELYAYLRNGGSPYHGVAIGSMADVVHQGLAAASDDDIEALAVYFSDKNGSPTDQQAADSAQKAISQTQARVAADLSHGEKLFAAACSSCHFNVAEQPNVLRPELSLNSAVTAQDPVNLIRVTLAGVSNEAGLAGALMPGFADALSDQDIASLLRFLRSTHTAEPAWENLEQRVQNQRQ